MATNEKFTFKRVYSMNKNKSNNNDSKIWTTSQIGSKHLKWSRPTLNGPKKCNNETEITRRTLLAAISKAKKKQQQNIMNNGIK